MRPSIFAVTSTPFNLAHTKASWADAHVKKAYLGPAKVRPERKKRRDAHFFLLALLRRRRKCLFFSSSRERASNTHWEWEEHATERKQIDEQTRGAAQRSAGFLLHGCGWMLCRHTQSHPWGFCAQEPCARVRWFARALSLTLRVALSFLA